MSGVVPQIDVGLEHHVQPLGVGGANGVAHVGVGRRALGGGDGRAVDGVLVLGDDDADPADAHIGQFGQGAVGVGVAVDAAPPGGEGVAALDGRRRGLSGRRPRGELLRQVILVTNDPARPETIVELTANITDPAS